MTIQRIEGHSALKNFTVLERVDEVAGRYCGRLLAAQGARVLIVGTPSPSPYPLFDSWLDEGKERSTEKQAWECLKGADPGFRIVLAGQSPDAVIAADQDIAAHALDVLRLGITWFGMDGPYRDWKGDDALIQALIGIAEGFGARDGAPMIPQGSAPQIVAGATLFVGALAAAWGRQQDRPIRSIDVDIFEAAMCFTETSPPMYEQNPVPPAGRAVNRFGANHPTTVYPTSDGWLGVTTLTPAQWAALAELVGRPDWADDDRFSTSAGRVRNADLLDAELTARLRTASTEYWLIEGQRRRVPLAPVPTHRAVTETDHWRDRKSFTPLAGAPEIVAPNLPFRVSYDGKVASPRNSPGPLPLSGLRVADFSMGWAGPLCTRLLGDFGAEIIKVESVDHYDWWRGWEPVGVSNPPKYELMAPFLIMNRNKYGVCVTLTTDEGRERAQKLVSRSDIVIENYAPGVMAKLGLAPGELAGLRNGLTMVSMGAFGASGPWSFFRAYGSTVEHASGMPHANGEEAWPPVLQHAAYGDPVAGLYAAAAALIGLHGQSHLGGSWFDLAQVECLFQLGADMFIAAQADGPPERMGSASAYLAPRCTLPCSDGHIVVCCRTENEWQALCDWADEPDWKRWSSVAARNEQRRLVERRLAEISLRHTVEDTAASLQSCGVPAAPVRTAYRLPEEPHLQFRGAWQRIDREFVGTHLIAAPVFQLNGVRLPVRQPAPTLGEHNSRLADTLR